MACGVEDELVPFSPSSAACAGLARARDVFGFTAPVAFAGAPSISRAESPNVQPAHPRGANACGSIRAVSVASSPAAGLPNR